MAELELRLTAAWHQAAADLGLTFTAPWHLLTPDHRRTTYLGLVHHFGGTKGTLLRTLHLGELSLYDRFEPDLHVAKLGPRHATYDRLLFRSSLIEWGYTGPPSRRPPWLPPGPHVS